MTHSCLQTTKPLVDAPFILELDNLTCYQLIMEPSRTVLLVTCSVLFCLCPNFECVAGIMFSCFLYLQNTIRFVSEKTENVFSVLLSIK